MYLAGHTAGHLIDDFQIKIYDSVRKHLDTIGLEVQVDKGILEPAQCVQALEKQHKDARFHVLTVATIEFLIDPLKKRRIVRVWKPKRIKASPLLKRMTGDLAHVLFFTPLPSATPFIKSF